MSVQEHSAEKKIWLVLGDKVGDNAQAEIIAKALGRPYQIKRVRPVEKFVFGKPGFKPSLYHIDKANSDPLEPPWPDLIITVGVYSLTGREVTTATVAAVLTILGYSLYDTIIVFDRVRENQPRARRGTYGDMVNRSIMEVLNRSIITTLTTVLPVACLFIFGGETLFYFALALTIGILFGIYSSIFVATSIVMWLGVSREDLSRPEKKTEAEAVV